MSFMAAPLAIAGPLLQGFASIQEGNAAKAQAEARKQELEREAQLQKIAATEQQAAYIRDLNNTSGSISALFGSRGLDPTSPSAAAIRDSVERDARRDTRRIAFNASQQGSQMRLAGQAALNSGRAAQTAGYLRGAGSLFQAVTNAQSSFARAGAGGG